MLVTDSVSVKEDRTTGQDWIVWSQYYLSQGLIVVQDNIVIIINCPMNVNIYILLEQNYRNEHSCNAMQHIAEHNKCYN